MGMDRPAWTDTVKVCEHGYVLLDGLGNGCLACHQDAVERLSLLAAKAIQLNAIAVSDVMEHKPTKAHLLYRKAVARDIAELRAIRSAEWVERECGWPEMSNR